MRKILGPLLLAALALTSLLYMQHQRPDAPAAAARTTTAPPAAAPVPAASQPARPPARPPATAAAPPAPAATGSAGDGEGLSLPPTAAATAAGTAQATQWSAARELAVTFLTAYARPPAGTSAVSWWAAVKPLLTTPAAADYEGTDPANVPFTAVTGPPVVLPLEAPDTLLTAVRVPTDAGPYLVEVRTTPDGLRVTRATAQGSR
jgi:hypothetical protein